MSYPNFPRTGILQNTCDWHYSHKKHALLLIASFQKILHSVLVFVLFFDGFENVNISLPINIFVGAWNMKTNNLLLQLQVFVLKLANSIK